MKATRKLSWLMLLVLVLSVVLTACGGDEATEAPEPTEAVEATTAPEPTEAPEATEAPEPTTEEVVEEYECTDAWGCAAFEPGQTIKIGYVGPMTGDYSAYGIDISRGAELAVNAHPEVKGFELELVIEDTQGTPEQGAAVANLFAADAQMVAVDGHTFSGSTEAAIPIYEEAGVVMMSPSATQVDLTTLGSQVFNRVAFHDAMQGDFAADYIYNVLGVRQIAVMHDGGAYGQGLAELTAGSFEALGGTVVGFEPVTPGETDYSAPLAAVAALEPELIYWGGYDADAAVLVTQMPLAGLEGVLFFGCDGTYGENYIDLAGGAAEGTFSTYVPIPESEAFDQFREYYELAYGDEQGKLSPFSPHGHDAMAVLISAIERVAVESEDGMLHIPRQALAQQVRSTTNFQGLTGTINCSDTGECAAASILFMQVQDGEWVVGPEQEAAPEVVETYECTDAWGCAVFEPGQTIKIGYVGPMTGDYSAYGIDISRGAELAARNHPTVKGFEIEVVIEDTQGTPEQGAAVANLFAADAQMVAVDGHTFSGSTEAAIPIYEEAGVVMMSPSATQVDLTTLGSQVFNRVAFHDAMQGDFAANYIYNVLGVRQIAVMHDGGAYGQGLAELTAGSFEALGGTVVGFEPITPGETDYSAPLAAVAALEPELIYWGGYDADAAVLVTQMPLAGLEGVLFFGCDGTYGENYIDLAGAAAEGTFSTYVPIPESAAFDQFRLDYRAAYGDEQGKLSPFSPHGHDAMAVLITAIEKIAVETVDGTLYIPRQALAEQVRRTTNYKGLTGTINCSDTGECAAASILFMQVQDGDWVVGPEQE